MTLVAPREIADLVYRCCRTAMIDAGRADQIAKAVMHAEVNGLSGLRSFVDHHEMGSLEAVADAIVALEVAEVEARESASSAVARFATPIATALLAAPIADAGARGIKAKLPSSRTIGKLELQVGAAQVPHQSNAQVAFAAGVVVNSAAFAAVTNIARSFLVAECILDAAVPDD